jgi:hypothetical protein
VSRTDETDDLVPAGESALHVERLRALYGTTPPGWTGQRTQTRECGDCEGTGRTGKRDMCATCQGMGRVG